MLCIVGVGVHLPKKQQNNWNFTNLTLKILIELKQCPGNWCGQVWLLCIVECAVRNADLRHCGLQPSSFGHAHPRRPYPFYDLITHWPRAIVSQRARAKIFAYNARVSERPSKTLLRKRCQFWRHRGEYWIEKLHGVGADWGTLKDSFYSWTRFCAHYSADVSISHAATLGTFLC
jgi:hypothetical protein